MKNQINFHRQKINQPIFSPKSADKSSFSPASMLDNSCLLIFCTRPRFETPNAEPISIDFSWSPAGVVPISGCPTCFSCFFLCLGGFSGLTIFSERRTFKFSIGSGFGSMVAISGGFGSTKVSGTVSTIASGYSGLGTGSTTGSSINNGFSSSWWQILSFIDCLSIFSSTWIKEFLMSYQKMYKLTYNFHLVSSPDF